MASRARGQSFVSKTTIDAKRQARREYLEGALKDAKYDFERKEKERKRKHESGEDTWMLPSLNSRLIGESSKDGSDKKKKKKKKHEKKSKKHKKHRKKQKKQSTDSDSSHDSDGSTDDDWVEKDGSGDSKPIVTTLNDSDSKESSVKRESWMLSSSLLDQVAGSSKSRQQTRDEREEKLVQEKPSIEQIGQHSKELNPYWKDGGKGLPPEKTIKTKAEPTPRSNVGDAGRSWIHRAYERAKEQAEQQGRSLEDVVIERWGSMEKLNALLGVANRSDRHRQHEDTQSTRPSKERWRKHTEDDRNERLHDRTEHRRDHDSPPYDDRDSSRKPCLFKKLDEDSRSKKVKQAVTARSSTSSNRHAYDSSDEETKSPTTEENLPTKSHKDSSESSSGDSEDEAESEEDVHPLTEKELNELNAKILRAELMGNEELAGQLKRKLEAGKKATERVTTKKSQPGRKQPEKKSARDSDDEEEVMLTRTDRHGNVFPLQLSGEQDEQKRRKRKKKKKIETHDSQGNRLRYFQEDDDTDLQSMCFQASNKYRVRKEKLAGSKDQAAVWSKLSKLKDKVQGDYYTLDDMFETSSATKESRGAKEEKLRNKVIAENKKMMTQLENCRFCFGNPEIAKHLIIAIASKVYLALPISKSFTDGHCLIIPMSHIIASTFLDEDVLQEVQTFKKTLVEIFKEMGKDVIFLETCRNINLKKQYHMVIECIPVSKEDGDMADIYFKKGIMESETEWSQNKKLIDVTKQGGIRRAVPKGLAYFAVEFGLDGGFAHVIEDDDRFPHYFGKEIIGGMLDLEPVMWRKPPKENFQQHKKKVLQFADWWKPHDWTHKISKY